jgi:hypothetical protein
LFIPVPSLWKHSCSIVFVKESLIRVLVTEQGVFPSNAVCGYWLLYRYCRSSLSNRTSSSVSIRPGTAYSVQPGERKQQRINVREVRDPLVARFQRVNPVQKSSGRVFGSNELTEETQQWIEWPEKKPIGMIH